ncbi:MAG: DUF1570 domain-containing protein [Fuerstiella sp.]
MFTKRSTLISAVFMRCSCLGVVVLSATADCQAQASQNGSQSLTVIGRPQAVDADREVVITTKGSQSPTTGRIVTETPDGMILLEQSNGSYVQILADDIATTTETGNSFASFSAAETGSYLKQLMGNGEVTTTQHFVICSAASPHYTRFCGQLLERVATQFPLTLKKCGIDLPPLPNGLAVMIFATSADLKAFAEKQHPEVDFSDTPGYYSVTHNQILFSADQDDRNARSNTDIARGLKRSPRIVETMVHETVHLLQYNSGLMNRFAANPTWIAEGMAVFFEPVSLRSSLLWSRAGDINELHLEGLKAAAQGTDFMLPLQYLFTDDQAFANAQKVRSAYAESWAITWTLMKRHPKAYGRLLEAQMELRPLVAVTHERRIEIVETTLQMSLEDLQAEVRKALRRQL